MQIFAQGLSRLNDLFIHPQYVSSASPGIEGSDISILPIAIVVGVAIVGSIISFYLIHRFGLGDKDIIEPSEGPAVGDARWFRTPTKKVKDGLAQVGPATACQGGDAPPRVERGHHGVSNMRTSLPALSVSLLVAIGLLVPCMQLAWGLGSGPGDPTDHPVVEYEGYHVEIDGAYAVTNVERVLRNPSDGPINYSFSFRLPEDAMISNYSITIDGVTYFADVLEREEAEERFNESVAEGRDAGLVASFGESTFSYSVSISPRETVSSVLRFEQMLLKASGWYEYHLFMDEGTGALEREVLEVDVTIRTTTGIDEVETAGYDDLIDVGRPDDLSAIVIMRAEHLVPDEDLEVRWCALSGPMEGMMYFGEWDGMGYFVHVFDPDPGLLGDERVPKDFVFILDKSGSMGGHKFSQSQQALRRIYGSLSMEDRFGFVEFNREATKYSDNLRRANEDNVASVLRHIDRLSSGGGTNIHAGVMDGLEIYREDGEAVPVIVLLTDGMANVGLYDRSDFRKDVQEKNDVDASIYCIALGDDADWTFLEALALENHGRAIWVREDEDVVAAIDDFVKTFSSPLLADLSFAYGEGVSDVYPSQFPAHYEGSEILLAGRFPLDQREVSFRLEGRSGGGDVLTEDTFPVDSLQPQDFVPRFWAFQRIRHLEDRMKYNGTDNASVQEITRLSLEFHFVTEYTSLYVELPEEVLESHESTESPYYPDYSSAAYPSAADSYSSLAKPAPDREDSSPGFSGVGMLVAIVAAVAVVEVIRRARRK